MVLMIAIWHIFFLRMDKNSESKLPLTKTFWKLSIFLSLLTIHFRIVEKGNLYDKYHEVVLKLSNLPPHNSTFYNKFDEFVMPKTEG